jgi:signal transduction histidine kinase
MASPNGRPTERLRARRRRPTGLSIRVRAALGAGLVAALAFGAGALWLRGMVYEDRMRAAIDQAGADARSIAEAYLRDGRSGPVPDAAVAWTLLMDDTRQPMLTTNGELDPFVSVGELSIEPHDDGFGTVTAHLGSLDRRGYSSRLEHRTVTLAYLGVGGDAPGGDGRPTTRAGATVYVLASPLPAEDAVAALDRGFAVGVPVAVLLVAVIAWLVTGRALRPVEAIRSELADISAHRLGRRVPVPDSGDEVARLATTTNETLDRLLRSVDQQRRFVADAAHELRSPLANLRSALEVATVHSARTDWPAVVRTALGDTMRLQRLTDDLLLLARLDRAVPVPDRRVDVAALADEQVAERRHRGADGIVARTAGPTYVRGDEVQLGRVLGNLLDNALRYGGGTITVTVAATPTGAAIEVSDDGPGIAPADRERVFERFTRLDDARARDVGGVGLGLAIARDIVTAHGGTIEIADAPAGTRVVVRLPRRPVAGPAPRPAGPAPPPPRRRAVVAVALVVATAAVLTASVPVGRGGPAGPGSEAGPVLWAGRDDVGHVYHLFRPCSGCPTELARTTDGGFNWHDAGADFHPREVEILGPDVLVAGAPDYKGGPAREPSRQVTFDGGVRWGPPVVGTPIDSVPPGGRLFCWPPRSRVLVSGHDCVLHTADRQTRRIRPLSSAPPLRAPVVNRVPSDAGLWVSGVDQAGRPAVAASHDSGRTWTTFVFADLPEVTVDGGYAATIYLPEVVSADGATAYAVVFGGQRWRTYRTDDGGASWVGTGVLDLRKSDAAGGGLSFVTRDNVHMVATFGPAAVEYLAGGASRDTYRAIVVTGMPPDVVVSMSSGGGYLAYSDREVYLSDDGWTWGRVWQE